PLLITQSLFIYFSPSRHPRDLHSFPTRRSSDLALIDRITRPNRVRYESPGPATSSVVGCVISDPDSWRDASLAATTYSVTPPLRARYRVMRRRTSDVIRFLMVLIIATACGSANPTVATKTPVSAAILDDHFGFLVGNAVRTESDTKPLFVLPIPEDTAGVVSPDGRRLAYVGSNDVRVI